MKASDIKPFTKLTDLICPFCKGEVQLTRDPGVLDMYRCTSHEGMKMGYYYIRTLNFLVEPALDRFSWINFDFSTKKIIYTTIRSASNQLQVNFDDYIFCLPKIRRFLKNNSK